MRAIWILAMAAIVSGCVQPAGNGRYQRPGPSEAYVDLRAYVFNGQYTAHESPKDLIAKLNSMGGAQGQYETNSEFSKRMAGLGLSAVMSEVKDYQVDFDNVSGGLTFKQGMQDAQMSGFKISPALLADYKNSYYSIMLPGVEYKTGEFVGQNAYGAKAVIDQVVIDRVYLVGPAIPKPSLGVVFVDLIAKINLTASEFKLQRDDLRLAIIFEPIPNYIQKDTTSGLATIANKREATINNYFVSSKLAAVSVVNIKTRQVVSDVARIRFKTN